MPHLPWLSRAATPSLWLVYAIFTDLPASATDTLSSDPRVFLLGKNHPRYQF